MSILLRSAKFPDDWPISFRALVTYASAGDVLRGLPRELARVAAADLPAAARPARADATFRAAILLCQIR